jgi:4-diphosphocytidyl-2-C-methyl-D-erythritol kinase
VSEHGGRVPAQGEGVVVVRAPAKLTVSLRVTGVRADGYHLIDAEMVTVDLADELEIGPGDDLEVVGASGLPVPADDDNLVRRALRAVGRTASVRLVKRIPAGAGLGGGSADAAAVLRWAGCGDLDVAAALGADVPFCVRGGRARVTGVGDVVEPLPALPRTFTLLTPPFGVSTPAVYRAWDDLGGPTAPGPNDLEPAALVAEPRLAEWRERLAAATGTVPVLAGSGSTWFVEGVFPGDGRVVTRTDRPA